MPLVCSKPRGGKLSKSFAATAASDGGNGRKAVGFSDRKVDEARNPSIDFDAMLALSTHIQEGDDDTRACCTAPATFFSYFVSASIRSPRESRTDFSAGSHFLYPTHTQHQYWNRDETYQMRWSSFFAECAWVSCFAFDKCEFKKEADGRTGRKNSLRPNLKFTA